MGIKTLHYEKYNYTGMYYETTFTLELSDSYESIRISCFTSRLRIR